MNTQEADIAAINSLYEEYVIGVNTGDLDRFISVWAEDATRMEAGIPAITGKEQIRAHFTPLFEGFINEVTVYGEMDVGASGDLAFSRGNYTLSFTPKDGGPKTTIDGKWVDTLKRGADGSWKIYIDSVNDNAPPTVE